MKLTNKIIEQLKEKLSKVISNDMDWQLEEITLIGSGVINAVFLIKEKSRG